MITRIVASALLATAALSAAASTESLRELNPIEASALGFGSDEGKVWRIDEASHGDFADLASVPDGAVKYTAYSAFEMRGRSSEIYLETNDAGRWCSTASTDGIADIALADLPHGASLQYMRIWGLDSDGNDDLSVSLIRRCFPTSTSGGVISTVIAELIPAESTGNFSASMLLPATTIDNNSCSYSVRTRFGAAASTCAGSNLRLQKVRFQWAP